jgi:hypothetical protein
MAVVDVFRAAAESSIRSNPLIRENMPKTIFDEQPENIARRLLKIGRLS